MIGTNRWSVLWVAAALGFPPTARATITLVDTKQKFASTQDRNLGKSLWKNNEYMARLQYVDGNLPLCPSSPSASTHPKYNLTVPSDDSPVAVLVRGGGCTLEDKVHFALHNLEPAGLVKFLIVDGDHTLSTESTSLLTDSLSAHQDALEIKRSPDQFDTKQDNDIPLYILHISYHTEYDLLDIILHQSSRSQSLGGPRIVMDSRLGTGFLSGPAAVWIGLLSLLSACACSCLLVHGGSQWMPDPDDQEHVPQRPTRRRLTKNQVKAMLPVYQFDGETIKPAHGRSTPALVGPDGLETEILLPDPATLECCSICIDDYESGDRLRMLPCHHLFHSKCIGRWLSERSSTCPLCKLDLFQEDDEEETDEEQPVQEPLRSNPLTSTDGVSVWRSVFGLAELQTQPTHAQSLEATNDHYGAPEVVVSRPPSTSTQSWWRRLLPSRSAPVEPSTEERLTEPLLPAEDEEAPAPSTSSGTPETHVATADTARHEQVVSEDGSEDGASTGELEQSEDLRSAETTGSNLVNLPSISPDPPSRQESV
jgi:hypothetical protein